MSNTYTVLHRPPGQGEQCGLAPLAGLLLPPSCTRVSFLLRGKEGLEVQDKEEKKVEEQWQGKEPVRRLRFDSGQESRLRETPDVDTSQEQERSRRQEESRRSGDSMELCTPAVSRVLTRLPESREEEAKYEADQPPPEEVEPDHGAVVEPATPASARLRPQHMEMVTPAVVRRQPCIRTSMDMELATPAPRVGEQTTRPLELISPLVGGGDLMELATPAPGKVEQRNITSSEMELATPAPVKMEARTIRKPQRMEMCTPLHRVGGGLDQEEQEKEVCTIYLSIPLPIRGFKQ